MLTGGVAYEESSLADLVSLFRKMAAKQSDFGDDIWGHTRNVSKA